MARHRWTLLQPTPDRIPGVYKAEICVKCGCVKLHLYLGRIYTSSYLLNGKELSKLPECK
nr:MAG TPA: hypothetical protein [Caudoviricetes sp.]